MTAFQSLIFSSVGFYLWFKIFTVTTAIAVISIEILKQLLKLGHMKMFRRRASLVMSLWLGVNIVTTIYFLKTIQYQLGAV